MAEGGAIVTACDEYQGLLVGLIDQELSPDEARKVNDHLVRCARCREEYEKLRKTAKRIESVSLSEPQERVLESLWSRPYSRFTRLSALLLVLAGYLALILYGVYEFLIDQEEAAIPKVAAVAVLIGFIVLLFSVVRERLKTYKSDPYKEVER